MKVLHVIPSYEPAWAFGGTVTATSQLCRALAERGVDVTVYTTDADGKDGHLKVPLNKSVNLGGVKTWYFRCNFGMKRAFYSKDLANKLKDTIKEFDLIHVSAMWQWIQVDVYRMCKFLSIPYIISTHGSLSTWPWKQNPIRKRIYWNLFSKKTIKGASAIHFTSQDERMKSFSTIPFLKNIQSFVIPNGLDIKKIKKGGEIRGKLGISDNKFILLFIGRIHRKKGIHFILEALKNFNGKDFVFLMVGNKEDVDYVRYLTKIALGIKDKVIWLEPVASDEVWDFYFSSDLFVLPSYDENFGMVVVEAMACGLPVLISKYVGIWREVQSNNAGFVVNQDVNEIVNVLKILSKDNDIICKMSKDARKFAKNGYNIENVVLLMIKAYENVLGGNSVG